MNFVRNNEKDILNNKYDDLSLKYIINSVDSGLYFERKLNSYIYNYIKTRHNFTRNKFIDKDFNYDEKDFNYINNIDFLNSKNTSFLFDKNKSLSYSDELLKKYFASRVVNNTETDLNFNSTSAEEIFEENDEELIE